MTQTGHPLMPYGSGFFETFYAVAMEPAATKAMGGVCCNASLPVIQLYTPLVQWLEQYGGLVSSLLSHTPWYQRVTDNVMHRQMILDPGELLDIVYCTRTCL